MRLFLSVIYIICIFYSCRSTSKRQQQTIVSLDVYSGDGDTKAYLETIPYSNEKKEIIDSIKLNKYKNKPAFFSIPHNEERSYRIRFSNSRLEVILINDSPEIIIHGNIYQPNNYSFENSPASSSIKSFINEKLKSARELRIYSSKFIKPNKNDFDKGIDSFNRIFNNSLTKLNQKAIDFADTVSSPAAFLFAYNSIDFGKNYSKLKDFILKNAKRFPDHSRIQKLKNETLEYLRIFEEEFEIGSKIPDITLPDQNNNPYSTSSLHGKFYLLNFWSSWCDICMNYIPAEKKVKKYISPKKFEMVNIAIDSEKEHWKHIIISEKLEWPQLIDDQMWKGKAINTYKIDSIPFNFLIDKEGKILKKAIPADSVIYFVKMYVK